MTPTLTPIPHDLFLADVGALAAAVAAEEWRPDFVVGMGRGGLVPGCYLSHALDRPLLSIDLSSGFTPFGWGLLGDLAARARAGTRLLLVDDINDSGRTIGGVRHRLEQAGAPATQVRVAVLIDNVGSAERVDYRARTIDRATCKDWFVFPWESLASRETLVEEAGEVPDRLA